MPKYFIELSYDGLNYHGWQRQPKEISILEVIEECLTKLHSNKKIEVEIEKNKHEAEILSKPLNQNNYKNS